MSEGNLISAAVINYQTPDLLEKAVRSFLDFYPDVPTLIIDNGSADHSREVILRLQQEAGSVLETIFLDKNIYHGPAMHLALTHLSSPHVYLYDSDTETKRGGFLESMQDILAADPVSYGAGHIVHVNHRGFAVPKGIPVLQSAYMLLKREIYHQLPPFVHHGLPALFNFKAAMEGGFRIETFPVQEYIDHLGRGTAERFGYGLGFRSRLDYVLNRLGL